MSPPSSQSKRILKAENKNVLLKGIVSPEGFPRLPNDWEADFLNLESSVDGTAIFCSIFRRKELPEKSQMLVVSHGVGEHGGRYLHFPHYLKESIDIIACPDHRGHGRSGGTRGHVDQFHYYSSDLDQMIRELRESYEIAGLHAFGHSMGGLILLKHLFDHRPDYQSAIACSPAFKIKYELPKVKRAAGYALSSVWGSLQLQTDMNVELIVQDKNVQHAILTDQLFHQKGTPRFLTEFEGCMQEILNKKIGISCPIQFFIPLLDEICDEKVALRYYEDLQHPTKTLRTYPNSFHEIFNDVEKEQAFEDLEKWIKTHQD